MNLGQFANKDIVLLLIKKATECKDVENVGIHGNKALQKSIYFLNQINSLFYFRWSDYGPFCGEIQQIADYIIASEEVKVNEINIEKVNGTVQNLQFFGDELNEITIPDEINNNLDVIIKFVAGKTPDELEFLASVHYWAVRQQEISNNYSADYIFEKLSALNPNRVFKLDDVILAVKTLEVHKFLAG